jgi:MFS family permease
MIGVGLICFQNTTGIDAVLFYSETIFLKASSSVDSAIATIIIGVVMLVSSFITPFFVDSSGRKVLLIVSATGMSLSLFILGTYFYFDEMGYIGDLGWVPVTSLVSFIIFYCAGFGPIPFTVLSEMFSPETKSIATSIAISACWIVDFIVTKAFLPLEAVIGNYGNFWLFGVFSILALIFTITVVFETKGLTLSEIQDRLNGRNKNDVNNNV